MIQKVMWGWACSLFLIGSFSVSAIAYIPKTKIVLEKTAKNHGKGVYSIQLEVSFRNDLGNQTIVENWIIENGESMFVEARSGNFNYAAVYKSKQKYFMDESGSEKAAKLSPDFFEDIFHFRGTDSLATEFVSLGVVPARILAKDPRIRTLKDIKAEREPYIRLSRSSGVVTYALGRPTPADSATPLPGVWIEQDRFNIRRVRFSSQAELIADDYNEYGRGLLYPRTRTINWGSQSVSIRTIKVSAINLTNDLKSKLSPSFIRTRKQTQIQSTTADGEMGPLVKEFYQRFR